MIRELAVLDTRRFGEAAATVRLAMALRAELHRNRVGNWDVGGHPAMAKIAVNGTQH